VLFNAGREAEKRIYLTFGDGRIYLVYARAIERGLNAKAVQRLRELLQETKREVASTPPSPASRCSSMTRCGNPNRTRRWPRSSPSSCAL
jgi:hypothetical protein